jgi:double-stranded RNA-binding protein Staufen
MEIITLIRFLFNQISVEYQLEKESGPAHAKIYTVRLRLGEKEYTGVDRSIKLAQRAAAQNALDEHKHLSSTDTPNHEQKRTLIFS